MKPKFHFATVIIGMIVFAGISFALGATIGDSPRWYQEPAVFPIRVAIWTSGNAHAPSEIAGNLAWVGECLVVGLIADACVAGIVRLRRSGSSDEQNQPATGQRP